MLSVNIPTYTLYNYVDEVHSVVKLENNSKISLLFLLQRELLTLSKVVSNDSRKGILNKDNSGIICLYEGNETALSVSPVC